MLPGRYEKNTFNHSNLFGQPYLHESRHVHALKRARGPGGRFLNLKKVQENHPDGDNSDNTTTSNIDDYFHQQEHKFSIYNSHAGEPNGFGGAHHVFRWWNNNRPEFGFWLLVHRQVILGSLLYVIS